MTQEQIKQQAREMAERCAKQFMFNDYSPNKTDDENESYLIDRILRELNLVSLLEDKARLDWVDKSTVDQWDKVWANLGPENIRTAITNAMQEKESGE